MLGTSSAHRFEAHYSIGSEVQCNCIYVCFSIELSLTNLTVWIFLLVGAVFASSRIKVEISCSVKSDSRYSLPKLPTIIFRNRCNRYRKPRCKEAKVALTIKFEVFGNGTRHCKVVQL